MRAQFDLLTDAVSRLNRAFRGCGLDAPIAIVVPLEQKHKLDWLMQQSGLLSVEDPTCKGTLICGVQIKEQGRP